MMSEDKLRELFPSSARLAVGDAGIKGTNTFEQYQDFMAGNPSECSKISLKT
jgi:hypothetical protein